MSIAIRPSRRQQVLRTALLQVLARNGLYEQSIGPSPDRRDLRSAWKPVKARYWPNGAMPSVHQVFRALEDQAFEIGPVDPALSAYCDLLRSKVATTFRLRFNNEPAWWALEAFHNHVLWNNPPNQPVGIGFAEFLHWREVELKLKVTDNGATITAIDHFREARAQELLSSSAVSFQDWKGLEREAIATLKQQIAELRRDFEQDYQRAGTGRDQRGKLDADLKAIPVLVKTLLALPLSHEEQSLHVSAKRLQRMRRVIELDAPDKSS